MKVMFGEPDRGLYVALGRSENHAVPEPEPFDLCGGHLALDFANTVGSRHTDAPIEHLTSYERLLAFARQTGIVEEARALALAGWARAEPKRAAAVVREAIALREALYRVFAATVVARPPADADLATINRASAQLVLDASFRWQWGRGVDAPDALLAPITRAAIELLTGDTRDRVRICEADDCVWLFFDGSKNRSRRWCDMQQCGNRAKARRHYAATKRAGR